MKGLAAVLLVIGLLPAGRAGATAACDIPAGRPVPGGGAIVLVPADVSSIQAAVDAAHEGDTVLISPGVYHEEVTVRTPGLRIRGTDRDGVVVEGDAQKTYGFLVQADRVVIENLSMAHYSNSGVYTDRVTGFWGRYLTAYGNMSTGLYASESRCGQFDNSYASGNGFVGYYAGACFPCDTVFTDLIGVENAYGVAECNAGGGLVFRDSVYTRNLGGVGLCSWDGRPRPPQRGGAIVRGNLIYDNNNLSAPGNFPPPTDLCCTGIQIVGGNQNTIVGNTVLDHRDFGILAMQLAPYLPTGNVVMDNDVSHDAATFPNSIDLAQDATAGPDNCWSNNRFGNAAPMVLETVWGCGLPVTPPGGDPRVAVWFASGAAGLTGRVPSTGAWATWPKPVETAASVDQPDDDGDGDYANDGAVDEWLPALGLRS